MAFIKQLALGREVRAPIIRVVIVSTVVTPADRSVGIFFFISSMSQQLNQANKYLVCPFHTTLALLSGVFFVYAFSRFIIFFKQLQANNITAAVDVRLKDPDLRKYSVYGDLYWKQTCGNRKLDVFFSEILISDVFLYLPSSRRSCFWVCVWFYSVCKHICLSGVMLTSN